MQYAFDKSPNRTSKRWRALAALLAVPALMLAACAAPAGGGGATPDEPGAQEAIGIEGAKVALISCGDFNRWCEIMNHGVIDYLEGEGAEVTYYESNFDAALQSQQVDQAIANSSDLILIYAADAQAVVPALRRAQQQDVPVINLVSAPSEEARPFLTSSIEPGAEELGKHAGTALVNGLEVAGVKEGNIFVITGASATVEVELRMKGFNSVMDEYPQYKIVETVDGNWDPQQAAQLSQQLIAKYRDDALVGAFGMSDDMANAIIQTAKQAGLTVGAERQGLVVVASNCYSVGIDNILAGDQFGTSTEAPGRYSEFVQELVGKFLTEGTIPESNIQEEVLIDSENAEEWRETCGVI